MKTEITTLISLQDALGLSVLTAVPEGEVKAVVQVAHGMSEHKERYLPFFSFLCGKGFACVIHDHRGHGESVRREEDLGYLYRNGPKALVEDLHQVTDFVKSRFPGVPVFLLGHSMGSMVARVYLKRYDDEINGLLVSGSPSSNPLAGVGRVLASLIGAFCGGHHRSGFLQKLSFGSFCKNFDKAEGPFAWLSVSEKNTKAYEEDPLCGFVFTANGFRGLYGLMIETYRKKGWGMRSPDLPIHFISGKEDPCMTNEKKFYQSVRFLSDRGYQNVSSRLYGGLRHEILNEEAAPEVFAELGQLLDNWI